MITDHIHIHRKGECLTCKAKAKLPPVQLIAKALYQEKIKEHEGDKCDRDLSKIWFECRSEASLIATLMAYSGWKCKGDWSIHHLSLIERIKCKIAPNRFTCRVK